MIIEISTEYKCKAIPQLELSLILHNLGIHFKPKIHAEFS
jgi:hypothetical protein